jgi:hypothetical protein
MDLYFANTVWTLKAGKFEKLTNDIFKQYTADREDAHEVVMGDVTGDMKDDVVNFHNNGRIQICYATIGDEYSVSDLKPFTGSTRETGCLPNVDDDTLILLDTGQRELLFTDPQVIAVLASPPYHAGINNDGDGGTSFGYSKASGSTESNTLGFSVGASIGGGFEIPGIIETEFKTTITSSFGWTQSQSRELSESWGWNAPVGEDRVIFTAIPFDVYYYEVLSAPPGGETKPGDMITVNVPRKPNQYHKPLTTYNAVVPEEQRITLNHELGNPGSYFTPTGRDAEKFKAGNKGLFSTTTVMTAGEGNGSTTISIETVKTEEKSFAFDLDVEVEAEVEAGGVKMGVSAGFNYGYETTTSVSSGTYIEGAVPAIPEGSYSHDRDFKWGLMAYPKENKYTLVTYWVDPL